MEEFPEEQAEALKKIRRRLPAAPAPPPGYHTQTLFVPGISAEELLRNDVLMLCDPNRPRDASDFERLQKIGEILDIPRGRYASPESLCLALREKLGLIGTENLPGEVLVHLMELSATEDLRRTTQVDRRFRAAAEYVLRNRLQGALVKVAQDPLEPCPAFSSAVKQYGTENIFGIALSLMWYASVNVYDSDKSLFRYGILVDNRRQHLVLRVIAQMDDAASFLVRNGMNPGTNAGVFKEFAVVTHSPEALSLAVAHGASLAPIPATFVWDESSANATTIQVKTNPAFDFLTQRRIPSFENQPKQTLLSLLVKSVLRPTQEEPALVLTDNLRLRLNLILDLLFSRGENQQQRDETDPRGYTAAHQLIDPPSFYTRIPNENLLDVLRLLASGMIRRGFDFSVTDNEGNTPYHVVSTVQGGILVNTLLGGREPRFDPTHKNNAGRTPAFAFAGVRGMGSVLLRRLQELGGDINTLDFQGMNPVLYALREAPGMFTTTTSQRADQYEDLVGVAGCNPLAQDSLGQSALSFITGDVSQRLKELGRFDPEADRLKKFLKNAYKRHGLSVPFGIVL